MAEKHPLNKKVGVVGGGQLGRMLVQAAVSLDIFVKALDPSPEAPCKDVAAEFVQGSLTDFETVYRFGQDCDVLTVEIENVNTEALEKLQEEGKDVFPDPKTLRMIQDKRLQKQFYREHGIPTSDFVLTESRADVTALADRLPFVQKLGREGYDGRGVSVLRSPEDIKTKGFDKPSVVEDLVDIDKEISVITARNVSGEIRSFPPVELVVNHEANLLDYLISPAELTEEQSREAREVAELLTKKMNFVGLLAVELFLDKSGKILVNEVAPRPHNSGHHTIEANFVSQYEQHLRAVLGLPLGHTNVRSHAAILNLLGEEGHTGSVYYEGMDEVLRMDQAYVHLYGKKDTKPFRKMGHITVLDTDREKLIEKIRRLKAVVKVISK